MTHDGRLLGWGTSAGDRLGFCLDADGNTLAAGAFLDDPDGLTDAGSVSMFRREATTWWRSDTLTASDRAPGDNFGVAVALSGDVLVVGASGTDLLGAVDAGAVYVFQRSSGSPIWVPAGKITASDALPGDGFGRNVATDGTTILVGAPNADGPAGPNQGAAYVFIKVGALWTQVQKLTAAEPAASADFGWDVAVEGDTAAVAADGALVAGRVHVFARDLGGAWAEVQSFTGDDTAVGDNFGYSVSLDGDTIAAGAWAHDAGAGPESGAAYVFTRPGPGGPWSQQAKVVPLDAQSAARFGVSLRLHSGKLLVGAIYDDNSGFMESGAVYIFRRQEGGPAWPQVTKVLSQSPGADKQFGSDMDATTDHLFVGEYHSNAAGVRAGEVQVFSLALDPPEIVSGPLPAAICVGGSATFTAAAAGPNPTPQWRRDGLDITAGPTPGGSHITTGFNPQTGLATLRLSNAAPADAGQYDCTFANACGSVTSAAAPLTVEGGIVITDHSAISCGAERISYTCDNATPSLFVEAEGPGPLLYEWYLDGVFITTGPELTAREAGCIDPCPPNPTPCISSPSAQGGFFQFNESPQPFYFVPGESFSLECRVTGTGGCAVWQTNLFLGTGEPIGTPSAPQPVVLCSTASTAVFQSQIVNCSGVAQRLGWLRDGVPIADGPTATGSVVTTSVSPNGLATLTITGVRPGDAGHYALSSSNCCETQISPPALLTVCRADWDCSAAVNSIDISAYLTTWLASVSAPPPADLVADFNADGATNSGDISAFLTAWLAAVTGGC